MMLRVAENTPLSDFVSVTQADRAPRRLAADSGQHQ